MTGVTNEAVEKTIEEKLDDLGIRWVDDDGSVWNIQNNIDACDLLSHYQTEKTELVREILEGAYHPIDSYSEPDDGLGIVDVGDIKTIAQKHGVTLTNNNDN